MHFCGGGLHFDGVASRLTCFLKISRTHERYCAGRQGGKDTTYWQGWFYISKHGDIDGLNVLHASWSAGGCEVSCRIMRITDINHAHFAESLFDSRVLCTHSFFSSSWQYSGSVDISESAIRTSKNPWNIIREQQNDETRTQCSRISPAPAPPRCRPIALASSHRPRHRHPTASHANEGGLGHSP